MSWEDCQEFCKKLNRRVPGVGVGLPGEAAWEYACRAGTIGVRYAEDLESIAWTDKNSGGRTHAVAGKSPNEWGIYDMLGNIWEWCEDKWEQDTSAKRVIRGGSWGYDAQHARAACRNAAHPGNRIHNLGFRCSSSGSEPDGE